MLDRSYILQPFNGLLEQKHLIQAQCLNCGKCLLQCRFLKEHGTPGTLAARHDDDPDTTASAAYHCSLCSLCKAVCPEGLDPSAMFLEFRQHAAANQQKPISQHQGLINFERRGTSKPYTLYSLPDNCDTIFFPGCNLTGTRPGNTLKTYQYLQKKFKNIGIVLDCCTKLSHDLGRQNHFQAMFSQLKSHLLDNHVQSVVLACPGCHMVFSNYAREFNIKTVYEVMADQGVEFPARIEDTVAIHDPCTIRFNAPIQEAIRDIVSSLGISLIEPLHHKDRTFCCGQGGGAGCLAPELASTWTEKIDSECGADKIISYCSGCISSLSRKNRAIHLIDLVFNPERALKGKAKVSRAPFTYLNRKRLKRKLKQLCSAKWFERGEKI
mgnify:CR=1 FL=1